MSKLESILVVIGSPKGKESKSYSLATYITAMMKTKGVKSEYKFVNDLLDDPAAWFDFTKSLLLYEAVLFSFPLYVDSLPAPMIFLMEKIHEFRRVQGSMRKNKFMVICNSGFPEGSQMDNVISQCRLFSKECNFDWIGCLQFGSGGMVSKEGKPLKDQGKAVEKTINVLNMAVENLDIEGRISQEANELLAKYSIPGFLYIFFGNRQFKKQAGANKVAGRISSPPK